MEYLKITFQTIFAIILLISTFHWVRTRFWVPKYIHYLAAFMFIVGSFLEFMAYSISGPQLLRFIIMVPGFPIAVYVIFGLYGGGLVARDKKINEFMTIDRALSEDKIITILEEQLGPYRTWTYENLLLLSDREDIITEVFGNGKKYRFQLFVNKIEESDHESTPNSLIVTGLLVSWGKIYKPKSWASFIMNRNGAIEKDGLSMGSQKGRILEKE